MERFILRDCYRQNYYLRSFRFRFAYGNCLGLRQTEFSTQNKSGTHHLVPNLGLFPIKREYQPCSEIFDANNGLGLAEFSVIVPPGARWRYEFVEDLDDQLEDYDPALHPKVAEVVETIKKSQEALEHGLRTIKIERDGMDLASS